MVLNTPLRIRQVCSFHWQNTSSWNLWYNLNVVFWWLAFNRFSIDKYCMTISSQSLCLGGRRKCRVGFIHTQLASSYANAPHQLASSRSTVGFITRDFHTLISRQRSQTNRCGFDTLFLTSKTLCMQKISFLDVLLTTQKALFCSGLSAAAIPDEANCSWLHQSHHGGYGTTVFEH